MGRLSSIIVVVAIVAFLACGVALNIGYLIQTVNYIMSHQIDWWKVVETILVAICLVFVAMIPAWNRHSSE
ncbi:MAG: hypothetical protein WC730_02915 [Patescibacteria group bacterium]|jgi:hypothetical protein